eukprot:m.430055 g.430055  ORF g.430055 m.430055 type:complete len:85 (-) comp17111_c0_seq1:64-318(-)
MHFLYSWVEGSFRPASTKVCCFFESHSSVGCAAAIVSESLRRLAGDLWACSRFGFVDTMGATYAMDKGTCEKGTSNVARRGFDV